MKVSCIKMEHLLGPINETKKLNLLYRPGDANKYICELANSMKKNKNYRSLVLLDPFGMQVNWDSIRQLENTKTDLWILIPSGVIINRLLDGNGVLGNIDKLVSFFGLPEKEIREYFYKQEKSVGLFETTTEIQKKAAPIRKITRLHKKSSYA